MSVTIAIQTMSAIERVMTNDQGASFRVAQGQVLPHMKDAYRGEDEGFRSHLGASVIGGECARKLWYGFHWFKKANFNAKTLRLFNRGHLEEARFIAMFLAIGCQVYQQDAQGNQFRISELGGHFGGSGDGVVIGIPDLSPGTPCLAEFKTHGEKSFLKLLKEGMRSAKFEHYVQMNIYMRKMNLMYGIYCAVNKNTDEIYMEIIVLDTIIADQFLDRGRQIVMLPTPPDRVPNASPGLFICKYCEFKEICLDANPPPPEHNCRTCYFARPREDGTWWCESKDRQIAMLFPDIDPADASPGETFELSKERQLTGCKKFYTPF